VCKSVWIINPLVTRPNPQPEAPAHPFTLEVLWTREHTPIPHPFTIFTLDLQLSLLRNLGVCHMYYQIIDLGSTYLAKKDLVLYATNQFDLRIINIWDFQKKLSERTSEVFFLQYYGWSIYNTWMSCYNYVQLFWTKFTVIITNKNNEMVNEEFFFFLYKRSLETKIVIGKWSMGKALFLWM